jgi:hypothetical protein
MVDHLSNTAVTLIYIFLEDERGGAFCLGTFFSQASENQQFGCVFVASNCGHKAAARRVKFVLLFSVLSESA